MQQAPRSKRLFFALGLDDYSKQTIENWLSQSVTMTKAPTQSRNWHLTLLFLGETSNEIAAKLITEVQTLSAKSFELRIDDYDFWQHNGLFHLKPSVAPTELIDLAAQLRAIAQQFGIEDQHTSYRPHITLGRGLKHPPKVDAAPAHHLLHVTEFTLYHSTRDEHGLVYHPITHFPLN
ncbi:RNA 2',3'-cyclic phosphodiesterase [Pseudoalteromonas pernae]|uniref:RNA 2',3'-cyclic phosphodiesterase n=1 Tax=Pseudoalteromonas pernae TaxID=3118054 RepID=UPI003241FB79